MRVELTGPLKGSEHYLFLRREAPDAEFLYVMLETASPYRFKLPAGEPREVVCGVVVSEKEIADAKKAFQENLVIDLETP
jgi:hypothetical protein